MAITNHERIGKMLELLTIGLRPFVERELKNSNPPNWFAETSVRWPIPSCNCGDAGCPAVGRSRHLGHAVEPVERRFPQDVGAGRTHAGERIARYAQ